MSTRREYLTHLFQLLDQRQIPWCVLRNYKSLFEESGSDVDLITLPAYAQALTECGLAAGRATGHRLVQQAQFVNQTLVFWNGASGYVRIDVDTGLRWKRFHLLAASQILAARERRDDIYIPSATHEAVIIMSQALWSGKFTPRYARRLAELQAMVVPDGLTHAVFEEAFGWPENLLTQFESPRFLLRLAQATRRHVLTRPRKAIQFLGFLCNDAVRFLARTKSPPGLFLRLIGGDKDQAQALIENLAILFPAGKAAVSAGPLSARAKGKALFTGGLAIECLPATENQRSGQRPWLLRSRSFLVFFDPQISPPEPAALFVHAGSGLKETGPVPAACANFICTILVRECER